MSAILPPIVAEDVYLAKLEPHPRGRVGRLFGAALDLWCAMSGGLLELSSVADVVVRRRSDDGEELRMYGGPRDSARATLHQLTDDLERLTPADFRAEWGIRDGS